MFLIGVILLSFHPDFFGTRIMMPFNEIKKRFPKLPAIPKKHKKVKIKLKAHLLNPVFSKSKKSFALDHFFTSLSLTAGKSGKPKLTRIIHYGDSLIWKGNITGRLRSNFTNVFGNGGRGLIPLSYKSSAYSLPGIKQRFSRNWHVEELNSDQRGTSKLALNLRRYMSLGRSAFSHTDFVHGEEIQNLLFFYEIIKTPVKIKIFYKNTGTENITLTNKHPGFRKYKSDKRISKISLSSPGGNELYCFAAENNKGVVYSTVVRKGIFAQDFLVPDKDIFIRQLRIYKPNLLIFHFGKNESGWNLFDIKKHIRGVRKFIKTAREAIPDISILLVGPAGRLNRKGGRLVFIKAITDIINAQKKIALEEGAAFFNTLSFLGGNYALKDMALKGQAMKDYIHLTRKGGNLLADGIYKNLINEYRSFLKRKKIPETGLLFKTTDINTKEQKKIKESGSSINFDTVSFIIFLLIVFFSYWFLYNAGMLRIFLLLIASYYFYMSWNPIFIILIILSTVIDYVFGFLIYSRKIRNKKFQASLFLTISLASNLGLLFFFKYFNLFADFFNSINFFSGTIPLISMILPVGISFYTFQTMSYSLDIYAGKLKPIKSFPKFALFVSFFPQLVAGPIVRARQFLPQLAGKPAFIQRSILTGMFLIIVGLFKKVVISDYIAINFVDRVFSFPELYSSLENLFAVYGYGLQIYCDFSGYSDIAIGAAAMFGFRLPLNFNSPYKAHNLQDFWHRWHISLSTWLRDYLYIPLGGSKKGRVRTYINLLITMLLGGLWHGAAYRFILWGAMHGTGLAVVRLIQRFRKSVKKPSISGRFIGWFITFQFVSFTWIFFRADSMSTVKKILTQIAELTNHIPNITFTIGLCLAGGYFLHLIPNRIFEKTKAVFVELPAVIQSLILIIFAIIFYKTASSGLVPFIYFQF